MKRVSALALLSAVAMLGGDAADVTARGRPQPARHRARPAARPAPRPAADPNARIIVSLQPPPPPKKKTAKPAPRPGARPVSRIRRYRSRRYATYSRRATTLYLHDRPDGQATIQLRIGLLMNVVKRGREWSQVETGGLIRVKGWVPTVTLGLRVQKNTQAYGRPGGASIGSVAKGQLVHVVKRQGAWSQVRLMGYLPLVVWMKHQDLGASSTSYGRLRGRYPGGSAMVVSAGPVRASAGGKVIGRALDEGRVYRVRVVGRWSQIAMYDYSRLQIRMWVPTARLRWGGYPWYGTGYNTYNCKVGRSGSQIALSEFKVYASRDDAWPTIRILPNARFNLAKDRNGWVRISSTSCIAFRAYAEDRPGDWTPAHLLRFR